jgi:hypothetical protein
MVASKLLLKAVEQVVDTAIEQGWLDKIVSALSTKRRITLLGSTGVGKTNFLNSLKKFPPAAISYVNRTRYASDHDLKLSKRKFTLVDTPGDVGYTAARLRTLRENMTRGKIGIINVVFYGYHEYGADLHAVFTDGDQPKSEYLDRHRLIEIEALKEVLPLVGSRDTCDFFLTVITKSDLWWDDRLAVIPYYTLGDYANELSKSDLPPPMVVDYCSVIHGHTRRNGVHIVCAVYIRAACAAYTETTRRTLSKTPRRRHVRIFCNINIHS